MRGYCPATGADGAVEESGETEVTRDFIEAVAERGRRQLYDRICVAKRSEGFCAR